MKKVIISGGGTGGHIFPALSVANSLKEKDKNIEILFVGAEGKIEMDKVPAAGYNIIGLPIQGFERKFSFKNIITLFKLVKSLWKSHKILNRFKPDLVVGVGGYASGAILKVATWKNIPTYILEQNSYAGVTNRLVGKKVRKIFTAYENMERFFPKEKIILTGTPIRQDLTTHFADKNEGYKYFGLSPNKKTILVLGGSGGAKTINESVAANLSVIEKSNTQWIWQTGKNYFVSSKAEWDKISPQNVKIRDFVSRMDLAYRIADVVISRAGAGTIAELCVVGKPSLLVPSPNVAEDHQTKNASAMVEKNASILIKDSEAKEKLVQIALETVFNDSLLQQLSENALKLGIPDAAKRIVSEIFTDMNLK